MNLLSGNLTAIDPLVTIFVLGLLIAAIVVTIALSLYARKLYRDR